MCSSKIEDYLVGIDCQTVPEAGLAGKKNGELLRQAALAGFQAFLTVDQGIEYQQNLRHSNIAIIVVQSQSNRLDDLLPLAPKILEVLGSIQLGHLVKLI